VDPTVVEVVRVAWRGPNSGGGVEKKTSVGG
jgi:hypothetical protein